MVEEGQHIVCRLCRASSIMLLLKSAGAVLIAGTSGANVGFGDGQSLVGSPGAAFGSLSSTPTGVGVSAAPYIFYNPTRIDLILKPNAIFTALVIGSVTYLASGAARTDYAGHSLFRWTTGVTALVDGTLYKVSFT